MTSNFGKRGQNRPQNLVHEKRTSTNGRTSQLLDQLGPEGRVGEKQDFTLIFQAVQKFSNSLGIIQTF